MAAPLLWIELEDTVEVDRKCYYNPTFDRIVWDHRPADGKYERFDDEKHAHLRIMCGAAQSAARNSRDIKLTMACKYYERGEWVKAAGKFDEAIWAGCGRHPAAMADNAHVRFVLWDESAGDRVLLEAAAGATRRALGLGRNAEEPLVLLGAARLALAQAQPAEALRHLFGILAVRYHGDLARPARAWSIDAELDAQTVRMSTRDLEDLPAGARLSPDRRAATLVCRRANVTDHSAFAHIEGVVLHAAWALHLCGAPEGAARSATTLSLQCWSEGGRGGSRRNPRTCPRP